MEWPDLIAVELLVAISERGSLSAAAAVCGMAQPNASRSLTRLERNLKLTLVTRGTRGSTLTPEGLMVVEWSRPVLAEARRWRDGVDALTRSGQSTLLVVASQTIAEHLLPTWLARLNLPGVRVQVQVDNSSQVVRLLQAGKVGLGFTEGPSVPNDLHHETIGTDRLVVVVARGHPWADRERIEPTELAATPLVAREPSSGTRGVLEAALSPLELAAPLLELHSNAAVRGSVIAGTAPAVLSRLAVSDALAFGVLCEVEVAGLNLTRQLRAVWSGPRRIRGHAARLIEVAQQH